MEPALQQKIREVILRGKFDRIVDLIMKTNILEDGPLELQPDVLSIALELPQIDNAIQFLVTNGYEEKDIVEPIDRLRTSNYPALERLVDIFSNGSGADGINAKDCDGNTLLHIGVTRGLHLIVVVMLIYSPDCNIKDKDGKTVLHCACMSENFEIYIDSFLELGADVNAKDNNQKTPYEYATCQGKLILEQHFIKLQLAKWYLCENNLTADVNKSEHLNFRLRCEEEIDTMKYQIIMHTNITFYDVLTKGANCLEGPQQITHFTDAESSECWRFHIFYDMLHCQFVKIQKILLINEISESYWKLFPLLPNELSNLILEYLNITDLQTLLRSL